ncbi:lysylphosphatidylglycerol synthase transmembrane domain-containing protein [Variovorax sp. LjRoot84]|uniref:lysylphosphatidylglycerol synthase transmembrane domain-containing protein n=1 Tax=Variovorax sp. LjRoot84 TaxID=3342340 RepID=UPI003ECDD6E9
MADARTRGRGTWVSLAVGIAVSLACLGFIVQKVDLEEVRRALLRFDLRYLALGVLCLAFGYVIRILRWSKMLNAVGAHVRFRECAAPFLGSIAINNVLPLRLGDVVRALVFPISIGVPRSMSTSSLIMERLVDLMTLILWLALSLALSVQLETPAWLKETAVTLAVAGCLALLLAFAFSGAIARQLSSSTKRPIQAIVVLLQGFDAMTRPRVMAMLFGLSLLVWLGEAGLFYNLLLGFGFEATPSAAIVIMAIATLATLVPSSPGYVGPFHLAAFAGISLLGGTNEQAASFAVLSHLGLWVPTTLAGAVAIAAAPQMFKGLRRMRDQRVA